MRKYAAILALVSAAQMIHSAAQHHGGMPSFLVATVLSFVAAGLWFGDRA
jgi:hypothetical protein